MNLLELRESNADHVLTKRFIKHVLSEEAKSIDEAQKRVMQQRGFRSREFFSGRIFNVDDFHLEISVLTKHRFVDMKSRNSSEGKKSKKSHPVYNKIIWGHLPNIVKKLSFGYTDTVIQKMKELED